MADEKPKATWVWDAALLNSPDELLAFFGAQQVQDVYVQVDADVSDGVYAAFLKSAHERNVRVHALDGSPGYTQKELDAFLTRIQPLEWDGIHLDIEPYLSDEWEKDPEQAVYRYEQLLAAASASGWQLGADIPFWFGEVPASAGGTLAEYVVEQTDYIVIMAYRDRAEQILNAAETELALARSAGKKALVALETAESTEGEAISFYGKSAAYFQQEAAVVEEACGCRIAVHHAASWQELLRK